MTAQDFLNIWLKIIGISGLIIISLFLIGGIQYDLNVRVGMYSEVYWIFLFAFFCILLNFAFLIPMLVMVIISMFIYEKGKITTYVNFKKVKRIFRVMMVFSFGLIIYYFEWELFNIIFSFILVSMNTLIGEILMDRFWEKNKQNS